MIFQGFDHVKMRRICNVPKARFSRATKPSARGVGGIDAIRCFPRTCGFRVADIWSTNTRIGFRGKGFAEALLSSSVRPCRRLARRQKKFGARLIVRNWRLKSRQGCRPERDAIEIDVKPVHCLHQVTHDQIFRFIRHRSQNSPRHAFAI